MGKFNTEQNFQLTHALDVIDSLAEEMFDHTAFHVLPISADSAAVLDGEVFKSR